MRRVVDLSGSTSVSEKGVFRVRVAQGCLLISHGTEEDPDEVRIPAHEVAVLVLGNRLALTGAVLGLLATSGAAVVVLDERYAPAGLMLPVAANTPHTERLRLQIEKLPGLAPGLWQEIIQAKVLAQARVLAQAGVLAGVKLGLEAGLEGLAGQVLPGDPANIEAQAARRYWPALFGRDFKRHEEDIVNSKLNYGYAVLRGLVARSACAAGLHPALGIHHRNYRNPFVLADDLMEPMRPMVDAVVARRPHEPLDASMKRELLGVATTEVLIDGKSHKLIEACGALCQSLVSMLEGNGEHLTIPTATPVKL